MKIKAFFKKLFHKDPAMRKVDLAYPTKWEQCSREQFRDICCVLSVQGMTRDRALFLCLCKLSGIRPDNPKHYSKMRLRGRYPYIYNGNLVLIRPQIIARAEQDIKFVWDEVGLAPSPFEKTDRLLYNISFKTFFETDSYILRYMAEKDPAYLKEAIKILTGGRIRKPLDWQKTGPVIWWNGVKQQLKSQYPYVFRDGDSITDKTQAEILLDLLSVMNGDRPQENEKILQCDLHSVLFALNKKYGDAHKTVH
ncbi:MAG: hypothetical protein IKS71_02115 [Bacteroidales bacterium]|nr:hypothetical protein [Bacteroidales bacterium]